MKSEYVTVFVDGVLQGAECYQSADGTISGYDWETGQFLGEIVPDKDTIIIPVTPGKKIIMSDTSVIEV